jgi:hypothetical protein
LSTTVKFTFDEEKHEYRLNGILLPSVTQILSPLHDFSRIDPYRLERARQFGTAVHLATELDDANELDEDSLDPKLKPCLEAWRRFKAETGFEIEHIEQPVYSPSLLVAGTIDRVGKMRRHKNQRMVVDIKTGAWLYATIGLQLAGYKLIWNETHKKRVTGRASVRLFQNGKYKLDFWDDPLDIKVFSALIQRRNLDELINGWLAKHYNMTTSAALLEWADQEGENHD